MIITIIRTIIDTWFKQRSKSPNSISNDLLAPRAALQGYFGYDDFREGQREVVEKLLSGKNLLGAFPTAFGKSICYQLPGLMLPGLTVVISPLISLMKDQVDALRETGIDSVGLLNSSLTPEEYQQEVKRLADGEIKLLYVSPERFRSRRFLNTLKSHQISLFVVDEAHCISQWGHDFRPDYIALRTAIQTVNPYSVALLTATATPEVREDIVKQLQVEKCETIIQSVERPNLKFSVCEVPGEPEKYQLLTKQLEQLTGKGIVYAGTRRQTEEIAEYLKREGYRVDFYHGAREESERTRVQDAFFDDTTAGIEIVVATNAFGMGIDKPDIRYVIHWIIAGSLEHYYQEAGRAGRDGEDSQCILFFCSGDRRLQEYFMEESTPNKPDLLQLLKLVEDSPSVSKFRLVKPQEIESANEVDESKIRVGIGYLEKLGFLQRLYNLPSSIPVDLIADSNGESRVLDSLRNQPEIQLIDFCQEHNLSPNELIEELTDLQSNGYLRYSGAEDTMLIELYHGSKLFDNISEEKIGGKQYIQNKQYQLDQMILYARTDSCRGKVVRQYFGERVDSDCRCNLCDICDPSLLDTYNSLIEEVISESDVNR
ncbi:RecQ family ATP-dependent DNA helicase [Candidatus Poribacteria bacterium]|nr:MAG: RecQ family ATP-dependent DNA helicase [Candidatus Poribacteria bacterium]